MTEGQQTASAAPKKKKKGDNKKGTKSKKSTTMDNKDDGGGGPFVAVRDDEPFNPALNEPDAMAIINKGEATVNSVSFARKQELLVHARGDRRKWIQQVPMPYESPRDPNNVWSLEDRLNNVQSSAACKHIKSATLVLSELYGLESNTRTTEEVAQRIDGLVKPFLSEDKTMPGHAGDMLAEDMSDSPNATLRAYNDFWTTLIKPECALLVQGMRNFLGGLENQTTEAVASSMKSYVDSTYENLKSHVAWKGRVDPALRHSLESFLYGHLQTVLENLEMEGLFKMPVEEWDERLEKLQFVRPSHLEIQCLSGDDFDIDELLRQPIEALKSIDQYFSPYEKLQRILELYQEINSALSTALRKDKSTETKLPSADDVLPSIILAVLRAKPRGIFRNLQFVENFAPQEYLRGEAGYAYTNLYGAVQFLHDLNLDKPDSLSISAEEFRKGLEESVTKTQKRLSVAQAEEATHEHIPTFISASDVRAARLHGVVTDLDWAVKFQQEKPELLEGQRGGHGTNARAVTLPEGFKRNYAFLGTRPEDIRFSDVPQLLEEYQMLVHVTEQLLGEKAARFAEEKRKKQSERHQLLDDTFLGIESSTRDRALTS